MKTSLQNIQASISRKKKFILFVCFCCLFSALSAQDNYEIRKIKFSGNKTLDAAALLDNMVFSESSFITRVIQKEEPSLFSHEMIELDIERLMRYYQSEGFLHVHVKLDSLDANDKKRRVNIYIAIRDRKSVV